MNKPFKTEAKLLVKEEMKDINNKDFLILTFENIERKVVVFPTKMESRWDQLIVNENYKLTIARQNKNKREKDFLIGFKVII
ncbi:MAG: hypothetical protein AM1032_000364 [Mycoplasmataceae bacterium]|nr:MAG: hypothetical protein AM1032_000364 [Mycoplasmataceae bacterium]